MTVTEVASRFPGGSEWAYGGYFVYCPMHQLYLQTIYLRQTSDSVLIEAHCGCRIDDILARLGIKYSDLRSTANGGKYTGGTAEFTPWPVDGRFGKGNSYRWRKGTSGNPRGRPRKPNELQYWQMVTDHTAQIHELQHRLPVRRDTLFEKFRVLYELTGNAFESALLAGYKRKTAKSKSYLLARRARESGITPR